MFQDQELEYSFLEILTRIFDKNLILISNKDEIDNFLIRIIGFIKSSCFNKCSICFCNSLFSTTLNLIKAKLKENESKHLDACLLSDIAEYLSDYIGKLDHINQVTYLLFN